MQKKMPHSFRKVSVSESPFLNRLILPAPVDGVLADYFLAAAEAIAERGITLDFGSAEELLKTNTDNRDSWNPLVPMYDFRVNRLDGSNLIVVLGRDNTGKVVTANESAAMIGVTRTSSLKRRRCGSCTTSLRR